MLLGHLALVTSDVAFDRRGPESGSSLVRLRRPAAICVVPVQACSRFRRVDSPKDAAFLSSLIKVWGRFYGAERRVDSLVRFGQ